MKIANQQKAIIGVAVLAIVVLLVTTLWSRPDFVYQVDPEQRQAEQDAQAKSLAEHRAYLASIKVSPVASSLIFDEVIDEDAVRQEIYADLGATKAVTAPQVRQADLNLQTDASQQALETYIAAVGGRLDAYHAQVLPGVESVLAELPDATLANAAADASAALVADLYKLPVPKPAAAMQASIVSTYTSNQQMFADARAAAKQIEPRGQWQHMAQTYATVRTQVAAMTDMAGELTKLSAGGSIRADASESSANIFIPVAQAGVPTSIITDVPRKIEEFSRSALGVAIINFTRSALTKYAKNLEKNYLISSTLYYTNALVNTKYANEYLNKFVESPQDREMIKRFLPEFNCNRKNEEQLRRELRAKVVEYLGFDPKVGGIDPLDPAFYEKLGKVGDLQGDPSASGYKIYYEALAGVAGAVANDAASKEQANKLVKVPQSADLKGIVMSLDSISNQQKAATNALFNIPVANATTGGWGFASYMSNNTMAILKQFVIKGAVVVREQSACVPVPVLNPVIPGDFAPRRTPPTPEEIAACQADVSDCQKTIFASPPPDLLRTCPDFASGGGFKTAKDGLYLEALPAFTQIGQPIEVQYGLQPACGIRYEEITQTNDLKFTLKIYGADSIPTTCDPPANTPGSGTFDPNLPTIVATVPFDTQQLNGNVSIDSSLIAQRLNPNRGQPGQANTIPRVGDQYLIAIITSNSVGGGVGVGGFGGSSFSYCFNGSVKINLQPSVRGP